MNRLHRQILRFLVVGGTAFLIDYVLLYFFTEIIGLNYLFSSGLSFTVSVIYNYILSKQWVFDARANNRNRAGEFIVFIVLSVIGLGINQLLMYACVDIAGLYYLIAKIFVSAVVMVYNFITRKLFFEHL